MNNRPGTTITPNRSVRSNLISKRPGTSLRRSDIARNEAMELSQGRSFNKALTMATRKKFDNKINKHIKAMYTSNKIPSLHPIRPVTVVGKVVPKIKGRDRWWEKKASQAGQDCTERQLDIANRLTEDRLHLLEEITGADGGEGLRHNEGDLYADPHKVMEMLRSRSFSQLNSLKRSSDFKAEVEWRLGFRQFP